MADPIAGKMQEGVAQGVFPGAVLLVRHRGRTVHHEAYGHACLVLEREPATRDTVYDLASLTKPLAAATALAVLAADGRIALDDSLERFIPDLSQEDLRRVTLRHLLNHSAGLAAWRPFYERIVPDGCRLWEVPVSARQKALYDAVHREPLIEPVGSRCVYSDLGYILLKEILERVTGQEWAVLCHATVFAEMGMQGLFYMSENGPTGGDSVSEHRFAATEEDEWRGRLLRGEVHDEHAAVLGGVSAHAGLFGTAEAVAETVGLWLAAVRGEASPLSSAWSKEFVRRQEVVSGASWALGWDTPSTGPGGEPSSSGRFFSPVSFGHLGYTGTSVWVDPEQELIVVLLTNRVHPTRKNDKIRVFRPALHDIVFQTVVGR